MKGNALAGIINQTFETYGGKSSYKDDSIWIVAKHP